MFVTLMTDASHCHKTGVAGFGFWCASDRGKLAGGKTLKGVIKDSYEAEIKGVANSLKISIDAGLILCGDTVLIQLDNTGVVGCIQKKNKPRADIEVVLDYIFNVAKSYQLKLLCRHVKGHSRKRGNRFTANNHCDARAKEKMNLARSQFKRGEGKNGNECTD